MKKYGKDWGKVQQYVGTRSSTQARSHAQKFFQRLEKQHIESHDFIRELRAENTIKTQYLDDYGFDESDDEFQDAPSQKEDSESKDDKKNEDK